jgi:hypothetical protein
LPIDPKPIITIGPAIRACRGQCGMRQDSLAASGTSDAKRLRDALKATTYEARQ